MIYKLQEIREAAAPVVVYGVLRDELGVYFGAKEGVGLYSTVDSVRAEELLH